MYKLNTYNWYNVLRFEFRHEQPLGGLKFEIFYGPVRTTEFFKIHVSKLNFQIATSFTVPKNIVKKPAKPFNGVCDVPNPHRARVGTMAQSL